MNINPYVFREYDIRGVVEKDFNEEFIISLGKAIGTYIQEKSGANKIVLGRDCRLSSPLLHDQILEGLVSTGADVIDIGIVPTPVFYFAGHYFNSDGGVMITGSHNPPEFNGFKVCIEKKTIYGNEILYLKKIIDEKKYKVGKGKVHPVKSKSPEAIAAPSVRISNGGNSEHIIEIYIEEIKKRLIRGPKEIKIVIDAGNGTAGCVAIPILKHLECKIVELFCEPDGNFPNHFPDPVVPENLKTLIATVKEQRADLGVAFDGDADRIGVVDELGNIIWGDMLLILYAKDLLQRHPGAKIIYEVKCTQALEDEIKKYGGIPIMWKTGHSLIEHKIHTEKALLAGEMSGHIYFADNYYGFDDAIYAAARLVQILQHSGKTISNMISEIPVYYSTPEIRMYCPDETKFNIVKNITDYYKNLNYDVYDIDGARVKFQNGWALVRASNTQPALVLRMEANSKDELEKIKISFNSVLQKFMGNV